MAEELGSAKHRSPLSMNERVSASRRRLGEARERDHQYSPELHEQDKNLDKGYRATAANAGEGGSQPSRIVAPVRAPSPPGSKSPSTRRPLGGFFRRVQRQHGGGAESCGKERGDSGSPNANTKASATNQDGHNNGSAMWDRCGDSQDGSCCRRDEEYFRRPPTPTIDAKEDDRRAACPEEQSVRLVAESFVSTIFQDCSRK